MFEDIDFSPFLEFVATGDWAAVAVGGAVTVVFGVLYFAGKKVPALKAAADALGRGFRVIKPKPRLAPAPTEEKPAEGAESVVKVTELPK